MSKNKTQQTWRESIPIPGEGGITKTRALAAIDYTLDHPRVFHTPTEIEQARENVRTTEWGAQMRDRVVEAATEWPFMDLNDEELRELAPIETPDGDLYCGFPHHTFETLQHGNVCPIDGTQLSFAGYDRPGVVRCVEGHTLPNKDLPDDGSGWVADPDELPADWAATELDEPTRFRFVAEYNGWIVRHIEESLEPLAYAYAITENRMYARTVATLLDILATAYTTHTALVGQTEKELPVSRLIRPGYQVGRALKDLTNAADLVWDSGALERESPTTPDLTIRENVAENLAVDGADFIWRTMGRHVHIFHNGTGDYNEGLVAVSSLLGLDVGYATFALDGPVSLDAFLDNTVFRDGQYYETATMYAVSFLEWAELAYHLQTDAYPEGVDLYDDSRLVNLNVDGPARASIAGRIPEYGDTAWPDLDVTTGPTYGEFGKVLRFYARTEDDDAKQSYADRLAAIAGGDPNDRLSEVEIDNESVNEGVWPLFNLDGSIDFHDGAGERMARDADLLPAKGLAMLRPEDDHDRGAMLRYGPTLSHGHADELGLWIYGGGRELSFDPGHKPKRHFLHSFQRQTVTHTTAVVNETSQSPPENDGGNLDFFASRDEYAAVSVSNPQTYAHEGVEEYRRITALIETPESGSYLVDLFRVGGPGVETVDYSFHGQGVRFETDLDLSEPAPGSVASRDYWWGDKQRRSGEIRPFADEDWQFNAPPKNGYGFLGNPRRADAETSWCATWRTHEDRGSPAALRLRMLGDPDREVIVADGPELLVDVLDLDPADHTVPYTLARDMGGGPSQYVSVIEPVGSEFPVEHIESLDVDGNGNGVDPVAVAVHRTDGGREYVLSAPAGEPFTARDTDGSMTTDAGFAVVSVDAEDALRVRMEAGTRLRATFGDQSITVTATGYEGRIRAIADGDPSLLVDEALPTGTELAGRHIIMDAPEYSHNAPYRIERVESVPEGSCVHLEAPTLRVGRGVVASVAGNVVTSEADFPVTWTRNYYTDGDEGNEYFDGRRIVEPSSGVETTVEGVDNSHRRVSVADSTGFEVGDAFGVFDAKAGDTYRIPSSAAFSREDFSYDQSS